MGIIQLPLGLPAQVGIVPAHKNMLTTDNLNTITTAGYLNQYNLEGNPILPTDTIDVIYSYNAQTNSGVYGLFIPSISNGVITLNLVQEAISVSAALTANATNTKASALQLVNSINNITTSAPGSVALPLAVAGLEVVVFNNNTGANVDLYTAVGGTDTMVNASGSAIATTSPYVLATNLSVIAICITSAPAGLWILK